MKRHVQLPGVRKWAGSHLIELQSEGLAVLDNFFADHGSFVIRGCGITKNGSIYNVAPGLVVLGGKDEQGNDTTMVVPFAGASGVSLPLYLTLDKETRQRAYNDGIVRPIAYDYYAKASTVKPGVDTPYLSLNTSGTPRYLDAIQDAAHRFITDTERSKWDGAVSDLKKAAVYRGALSAANANDLTLYGVYEIRDEMPGKLVNFPAILAGVLTGTLTVSAGANLLTQVFVTIDSKAWMRTAIKQAEVWTGWTVWERFLTQTDMENFDPYMVNQLIFLNPLLSFNNPKYLPADGSIVSKLDYPDLLGTPIFEWEKIADVVGTTQPNGIYRNHPLGKYVFYRVNQMIYSSPDGITWTSQKIGKSGDIAGFYAESAPFLTKLGTRWMAWTGTMYQAKYSDDDRNTWKAVTVPYVDVRAVVVMGSLCYHEGIAAMVGINNESYPKFSHAWFSKDKGSTWERLTLNNDPWVTAMAMYNGIFLIGTQDGKLMTTSDFDFRTVEYRQLPYTGSVTAIYYGDGTYIVRFDNGVCISRDLANWEYFDKIVMPLGEYYYESGVWTVLGTLNGVHALYMSSDLKTWTGYAANITELLSVAAGPRAVGVYRDEVRQLRLDRIKIPNVALSGSKVYIKALK